MATTTPKTFDVSRANVTPEKIAAIVAEYESNLRDSDKADSTADANWYDGHVDGYEWVLGLLTDAVTPSAEDEPERT